MSTQPQHIAIIMDGNGRWAEQRNLPRSDGHRAGVEALQKTIKAALEANIATLSFFAFSTENWQRPTTEVEAIMALFLEALHHELPQLNEHQIRLRIVGDQSQLSKDIRDAICESEAKTQHNKRMTLVIAMNYGGRWDILQATKKIAQQAMDKKIELNDLSEDMFSTFLSLQGIPDPDLFIRSSGEQRISNFFLWNFAYTEFYFTDVLWPDFDENEFKKALNTFQQRERRFGTRLNSQEIK